MSEEIEWLDEELTTITNELTEKLKELTSRAAKTMSKGVREDKVGHATSEPQDDAETTHLPVLTLDL